MTTLATWSLRLVLVAAGAVLIGLLIGQLWVIVWPVLLGVILATVLRPPVAWLIRRGLPPAPAALLVVAGALGVLVLIGVLLAPSVVGQADEIAAGASAGLQQIQTWLSGPPFNLGEGQIGAALNSITGQLQASASAIASGVLVTVGAVASGLLNAVLAIVLAFFFVKDGPRFLPWLHRVAGQRAGRHLEEVLRRAWRGLGGFIRAQALVSLVDAVFIGIGLVIVGVPLALPLAVLTFFGGFIPIVGALVAGAAAVLVALVTKGLTSALIVLGIIILVQQIEGNVLQPLLQSRSLGLHAVVVLLAVTAGGSLYGIAGAFLAVPVAAVAAEVLRYLGEQIDRRSGAAGAADPDRAAPDAESVTV
ncbi:AI-2E family transporter [Pseudonocardia sp. K10HN5]|uniref:AI-2E family transporter n=2 Tax=Pseudonocardia acidicola TaxID=2724939 RepID=A0ABX1SDZ9_9PSEU|nr:AI-2E family transporter [Pseudonocardia acidicola]NMH99330.1 AI-2E family transporter [Pseudonocardia acidicola]